MIKKMVCGTLCLLAGLAMGLSEASAVEKTNFAPKQPLPRPDTTAPDTTKPVKVFILLWQSNMVGTREIGPELGFGYVMGSVLDELVLVLKSCIGNRGLGWDLLPPGSERFTYEGRTYAGYKDTLDSWIEGQPKKEVNWYAGKQYDTDVANAKEVLQNLAQYYPDYKGQGYEVAGFVFWQGHKDQNAAHASHYEQNLVRFINCLRKDFDAPDASFVLATIAFGGWTLAGPGLTVANAQLAVSGEKGKYPEFKDNVRTVEARGFWREADVSPNKRQGYHYNRNAETYMEVGNALGWAMAELLSTRK